jgi:hypothetical protein
MFFDDVVEVAFRAQNAQHRTKTADRYQHPYTWHVTAPFETRITTGDIPYELRMEDKVKIFYLADKY